MIQPGSAGHTPEQPKLGVYVPEVRGEHSVPADLLPRQLHNLWDGIANDRNLDWHDAEVCHLHA